MLLSSEREFKDSHLFCQATTYPGHRFHMDRLGFFGNDIGVAEMSGMLFSKIKIIEPLTIETFRPSYLSMVV